MWRFCEVLAYDNFVKKCVGTVAKPATVAHVCGNVERKKKSMFRKFVEESVEKKKNQSNSIMCNGTMYSKSVLVSVTTEMQLLVLSKVVFAQP